MYTCRSAVTSLVLLAAVISVAGCRVDMEKNDLGAYGNVKVATPFGKIQIKTNDTAVVHGLGLPVYPGADLQQNQGNNDGTADVDMSFGNFRLRVQTASFKSSDSPDKVSAFYLKVMGRYGDVVKCQNGRSVGTLSQAPEGLTCDTEWDAHISGDNSDRIELKVGSRKHQHIVAINPDASTTKMQIVAVDLPEHIALADSQDGDAHKQ